MLEPVARKQLVQDSTDMGVQIPGSVSVLLSIQTAANPMLWVLLFIKYPLLWGWWDTFQLLELPPKDQPMPPRLPQSHENEQLCFSGRVKGTDFCPHTTAGWMTEHPHSLTATIIMHCLQVPFIPLQSKGNNLWFKSCCLLAKKGIKNGSYWAEEAKEAALSTAANC